MPAQFLKPPLSNPGMLFIWSMWLIYLHPSQLPKHHLLSDSNPTNTCPPTLLNFWHFAGTFRCEDWHFQCNVSTISWRLRLILIFGHSVARDILLWANSTFHQCQEVFKARKIRGWSTNNCKWVDLSTVNLFYLVQNPSHFILERTWKIHIYESRVLLIV